MTKGPTDVQAHKMSVYLVLARDGYSCQLCGTHRGLEVHHIHYRSRGGDDSECNLVTLCCRCHAAVHGGPIELG